MRPHGLDDNISWNVVTFYSTRIGGWCENWFIVYVGRKLPDGAELLLERRTNQALLDIIEGLNEKGIKENEAIDAVRSIIEHVSFNEHGGIIVSRTLSAGQLRVPERNRLRTLRNERRKNTVRPNADRQNLMALLAAADAIR
jgi:hypothetical protein